MSLHVRLVGPGRPNLLFLHGLFGQGRNWTGIAQGLLPEATSLLVDLPDHGHSPWSAEFSYESMADAVAADVSERLGSAAALTVVGHSMGGKVAMLLALRHPELVRGLAIVDIAPDDSSHGYGFGRLVDALLGLRLDGLESRAVRSLGRRSRTRSSGLPAEPAPPQGPVALAVQPGPPVRGAAADQRLAGGRVRQLRRTGRDPRGAVRVSARNTSR